MSYEVNNYDDHGAAEQAAEARIRELEQELKHWQTLAGERLKHEHRIAKAIEILLWAPFNDNNGSESALVAISRAKKALEGK